MAQISTYPHKKTIYLIRHGETDFNRMGIVQGAGVDSSLNVLGRKQAESFHRKYADIPFDRVYVSALKRTRESVEGFIEQGVPVTVVPELNEINWGIYEGKESKPEWKEDYHRTIECWSKGELEMRIPGGENPLELQSRQYRALDRIMSAPNEKEILICMHGRAMKSFLCLMLCKPLHEMEDFVHSNLCLYILEYTGLAFELKKQNCIGHLYEISEDF